MAAALRVGHADADVTDVVVVVAAAAAAAAALGCDSAAVGRCRSCSPLTAVAGTVSAGTAGSAAVAAADAGVGGSTAGQTAASAAAAAAAAADATGMATSRRLHSRPTPSWVGRRVRPPDAGHSQKGPRHRATAADQQQARRYWSGYRHWSWTLAASWMPMESCLRDGPGRLRWRPSSPCRA